jgi:hypothetical protein
VKFSAKAPVQNTQNSPSELADANEKSVASDLERAEKNNTEPVL